MKDLLLLFFIKTGNRMTEGWCGGLVHSSLFLSWINLSNWLLAKDKPPNLKYYPWCFLLFLHLIWSWHTPNVASESSLFLAPLGSLLALLRRICVYGDLARTFARHLHTWPLSHLIWGLSSGLLGRGEWATPALPWVWTLQTIGLVGNSPTPCPLCLSNN